MAKKVSDVAPALASDRAEEATAYLKRLIDEAQLREAVAKLIDDGQSAIEDLPAKGRKASKQAKKAAKKQLKVATRKATKQQEKLIRKGSAAVAETKTLAKQKKPGLKGRLALLGVAGVGALAVSDTLRSKLLDLLFGAEEEFQYTPPEPPEPPATDNPGSPLSAV